MKTETKNGTMIKVNKRVHKKLKVRASKEGKTLSATIDLLMKGNPKKVEVVSEVDKDTAVKITS